MRTTVNFDRDVESALRRLRRERGLGVSEAVNELVEPDSPRAAIRLTVRSRSGSRLRRSICGSTSPTWRRHSNSSTGRPPADAGRRKPPAIRGRHIRRRA